MYTLSLHTLCLALVAIQCICQAYSISIESDSDKELYEVKSTLEVSVSW